MDNLDKFNKKAKDYKGALLDIQEKIDDLFSISSGEEFLILYECLDALKEGKLKDSCFDRLKTIENKKGLSFWNKIKELLITAEYRKHNATIKK